MTESAWSAPAPIDIPWRDMPGGGLTWQVAEGDAWAFSYLVLQVPGTGKWRSNAPGGQDHDRRDQAVREVEMHFERCLRGCLEARPLEEFLDRIAETVDEAARDVIAELRPEAIELASFAMRPLRWHRFHHHPSAKVPRRRCTRPNFIARDTERATSGSW
ncbi:hypothetical protein OCH239_09405 [Roseivivax halodurans JCM 10272]|uniref:Uncharacterized protein n=1 Tax=Roseivivax halodurans JCM 10272 TaxID=1449350 RepID=X7ECP5_9RHOB|nr:hypothetical protein [Roseivivax halodurans]ETX13665.1 hypothetical protein OCH239_09405 [Roseivivax halodurans JCM 10272]